MNHGVGLAEMFTQKNRFAKADKIYKSICKRQGGGTNCNSAIIHRHEHLCNLGNKKSCDNGYVVSFFSDEKKTDEIALNTPTPKYTSPLVPQPIVSMPKFNLSDKNAPKKLCESISRGKMFYARH